MTIRGLYNKVNRVDTDRLAEGAIAHNTGNILDANLDQLLNGKNKFGEDIHPTYLEDDFFPTLEAAQAYSDWKDKISPFSAIRKKGVPNLFINGYYHSSIHVRLEGDKLVYGSQFGEQEGIEDKYNDTLYGLSPDSKKEFIDKFLRPIWKKYIEIATGLKMHQV